jgi:WD40 repeat protein
VAFSPHEDRLASAGDDKTIRLWDAASSQELRILRGHSNAVESVTFSPDGTRLVSAAVGGLKIWDTGTGQELRTLPASGVVAFTKDGKRLASARQNGVVEIWDAFSGQALHTLRHKGPAAYSVAFNPDGTLLASGGITYVQLWDTGNGKPLHTLSGQPKLVKSVAFSPDGALLASGSLDGTVKLWEPAGGKEIRTLKAHTGGVQSVAFSPDGTRLASGGNDKTIKIWNVDSGEDLRTLKGHTEPVLSVAFSRDGGWLASAGKDGLKLWDARPLSAALSAELEARSLVEFLRSKALTKAQALSNLHGNSTIGEEVRRKALEFVVVYWQGSTAAQEFIP